MLHTKKKRIYLYIFIFIALLVGSSQAINKISSSRFYGDGYQYFLISYNLLYFQSFSKEENQNDLKPTMNRDLIPPLLHSIYMIPIWISSDCKDSSCFFEKNFFYIKFWKPILAIFSGILFCFWLQEITVRRHLIFSMLISIFFIITLTTSNFLMNSNYSELELIFLMNSWIMAIIFYLKYHKTKYLIIGAFVGGLLLCSKAYFLPIFLLLFIIAFLSKRSRHTYRIKTRNIVICLTIIFLPFMIWSTRNTLQFSKFASVSKGPEILKFRDYLHKRLSQDEVYGLFYVNSPNIVRSIVSGFSEGLQNAESFGGRYGRLNRFSNHKEDLEYRRTGLSCRAYAHYFYRLCEDAGRMSSWSYISSNLESIDAFYRFSLVSLSMFYSGLWSEYAGSSQNHDYTESRLSRIVLSVSIISSISFIISIFIFPFFLTYESKVIIFYVSFFI
jgi:hypothetical protein